MLNTLREIIAILSLSTVFCISKTVRCKLVNCRSRKVNIALKNRGTKRLVSVNICSAEANSAGVFVSKVSPGILGNKGKMNAYCFRRDKTAGLGALKAQLAFSEG